MSRSAIDCPAWHDLIQHGNAHFVAGRFGDALIAYDQAVARLDRLLCSSAVDVALLISKVVTHQNRAATLTRLGRFGAADQEFRDGYTFARAIVDEKGFPENLRRAACCHRRMMHTEWQVFRSEHGHRLPAEDPMLVGFHHEPPAASAQGRLSIH